MSRVRWGQCFLVDTDACERIVEWARVDGRDVMEIGPGRGALTGLLRARAKSLLLVEIDPDLAGELTARFAGDAAVTVLHGDALRVDWAAAAPGPVTVVANLPYESGTAIVAALLARRGLVDGLVVMLQKEVVERLAAAPGSKTYGALSVLVQTVADVQKGMVLAPRSFRPRPKVESQMVRLVPLAAPRFDVGDEATFRRVVHASFGQRRKMLRNSLGRWVDQVAGDGAAARVFEAAGVGGDVRPEDLAPSVFAALSRAVQQEIAAREGGGASAAAIAATAARPGEGDENAAGAAAARGEG